MKRKTNRFVTMFSILVSLLLLAGCQRGTPSETEAPVDAMTPVVNTDILDAAANKTSEGSVTFVSGVSYSGQRRPAVVTDASYLPETPVTSAQSGKIVYTVNSEMAGSIQGSTVQNAGGATTEVEAVPALGYKFVKWSDGATEAKRSGDTTEGLLTAIFDYDVLDMPIVLVNTDDGNEIRSKEHYTGATISILGTTETYTVREASMEIRGRGNNSWGYPKKSYKFKLTEKENLFGMGNGKERIWVLLANQCDQSLQRNHVSFELARSFDAIDWQPASTSVEVYLNGEYVGVYLLAEDIKVSKDRVDVDTTTVDVEDIGYLLELSNYSSGEVINAAGRNYMVHNDLSADSSIKRKQKRYIQEYVNDCYDLLENGTKEECAELIDLDSLLAAYLTEEITKNLDSQWDSFYLSKDKGGKLTFGPVWDFDLSLGNANEGAEEYTDIFVGNGRGSGGGFSTWFAVATTRDWFRQMIVDKWVEIYDSISLMPQHILDEGELGLRSYERNFEKWQIFGTVQNRETHYITKLQTYTEHYQYLAEWLTNRIEWLNDAFLNETFVSDGTGIVMVEWMAQWAAEGWGGWGGGQSRYGNDETEDISNTYESLEIYLRKNTVQGPDGFPGEGVKNLFDDERDTKYCVEMDGELTVTFGLAKAKAIEAYMFRTANDTQENPDRNPDSWTLYGSSDGENWEVLSDIKEGETTMEATNHIWYGWEIEEPKEFKNYKIVFRNHGTMQLAEIRFLGEE